MRILLVEDETLLADAITDQLARAGYQVETVGTGAGALAAARQRRPDLVLLDIGLPDIDGLSVCRSLRAEPGRLPIILLTARAGRDAELAGFGADADDYITKPFDPALLIARIDAKMRLAGLRRQRHIRLGAADIDLDARCVTRDGVTQPGIGGVTFDLLVFLLEHPNQAFGKTALIEQVWRSELDPRRVDNHISKLRAAIEPQPNQPRIIVTLTGVGYRLDPTGHGPGEPPDPIDPTAAPGGAPAPEDPWRTPHPGAGRRADPPQGATS
jgi:two-component system response regulator MtrA